MPVLNIHEKKKQIWLPSTSDKPEDERAWVVMDVSPAKTGDLQTSRNDMSEGQLGMEIILNRLREWNFTDEHGVTLPINMQNFKCVPIEDFTFLQDQIEEAEEPLTDDERLKSSSTSQPLETVTQIEVISPPST